MAAETLKIGELASRTGVSIRTLRHYDEIGLLSPSHRLPSGHRVYEGKDLIRLHQVLLLRQLGFSLEKIGEMLARRNADIMNPLRLHVAALKEQIASAQELCSRLESVLDRQGSATIEELIKAVEVATMFEKYYTKDQLETLRKRAETLGPDRIREVEAEWPRLIAEVRREMELGTDPKTPRMQELARRWAELVREFTGDDPGITESLRNLYRGEPELASQRSLDTKIFHYVRRALA